MRFASLRVLNVALPLLTWHSAAVSGRIASLVDCMCLKIWLKSDDRNGARAPHGKGPERNTLLLCLSSVVSTHSVNTAPMALP